MKFFIKLNGQKQKKKKVLTKRKRFDTIYLVAKTTQNKLWTLKTEQCKELNLSLNIRIRAKFKKRQFYFKSLILAQDERWRRA